jgi:alkylation response protein AidB-like acyl-CoA dehydrogenase
MNFRYDAEQEELRRTFRRFIDKSSPESVVRLDMETPRGWNPSIYRWMCTELGIGGLAVPEVYGGAGAGAVELGIVHQESGRALLCSPLLSTSIAARVLLESHDTEACQRLLPAIAAGSSVVTLAAQERADWNSRVETTAVYGAGGWELSGQKLWVLDGCFAEEFIVSAVSEDVLRLFLVSTNSVGTSCEPLDGVDPTRRQASLTLNAAPATLLGEGENAAAVLERALQFAAVLLAAEQAGIAERCLDMARDYALQREQFGRTIGSFQAIKHKLANVLLEVEAAASASMYGLWVADQQPEELALVHHIALTTCSEAAMLAASENIQVHGGIGATWEHPAHLYLKRATTNRLLLGDPQYHRERLARKIGLAA